MTVPPTLPVVILPSNTTNEAAFAAAAATTTATATTPATNDMKRTDTGLVDPSNNNRIEASQSTGIPPPQQQQQQQQQQSAGVWSNGWNGNSVLNQPVQVAATPKSNYMYQKKDVNGMDSTTTTLTTSTQTPTFGSTIPPPPQQQQQSTVSGVVTPTVESNARHPTTTENNGVSSTTPSSESSFGTTEVSSATTMTNTGGIRDEGRPIFPSYVYPSTTSVASTSGSSSTSGIADSTVQSVTITNTDPVSDLSSSFKKSGMEKGSIATSAPHSNPSVEQSNQEATVPETNTNDLKEKSQVAMSEKVPSSSLWDDDISQRRDIEINQVNNVQLEQKSEHELSSSSVPSSIGTFPIEPIMSTTSMDDNTAIKDSIYPTTSVNNELHANYDEKNDPEPLKFNFMGSTPITNTVQETKTETSSINDATATNLSNESFLKAITSVETVPSTTKLPTKVTSIEKSEAELMQGERSLNNPLQFFWQSNMSKLKNLGKTNEIVPIVSVDLPSPKPYIDTRGMTERIMKKIDNAKVQQTAAAGGAGGSTTYSAFLKVEENWTKLKQQSSVPAPTSPNRKSTMTMAPFVTSDAALGNSKCWTKLRDQAAFASTTSSPIQLDYDITICGGTLGIFFALALLLRNPKFRICVVESAPAIRGRDQEWNISLSELYELIKLGVLRESDLDDIITTEFPACRSGFKVRL